MGKQWLTLLSPKSLQMVISAMKLKDAYYLEGKLWPAQKSETEVSQSCPTLCDPMDCSWSVSSVHGIFQARVLEWIAISFSRGSSQPRNQTRVSHIAGRRFTIWATRDCCMTNPDSILKSRDITLSTKVHLVKVMVFSVVMYGYKSWTTKKDEHWRTDAFELWCWGRLLRVQGDPSSPF